MLFSCLLAFTFLARADRAHIQDFSSINHKPKSSFQGISNGGPWSNSTLSYNDSVAVYGVWDWLFWEFNGSNPIVGITVRIMDPSNYIEFQNLNPYTYHELSNGTKTFDHGIYNPPYSSWYIVFINWDSDMQTTVLNYTVLQLVPGGIRTGYLFYIIFIPIIIITIGATIFGSIKAYSIKRKSHKGVKSKVNFSIYAPTSISPGSQFILNVWAYMNEQKTDMELIASREGNYEKREEKGPVLARKGEIIQFNLVLPPPFEVLNEIDNIFWLKKITNASFPVSVPESIALGIHFGHVKVFIQGIQVLRIDFTLEIGKQLNSQMTNITKEISRIAKVFASYSQLDQIKVLLAVQGLREIGIKIFLDNLSIRQGDDWDDEINQNILNSDLFLLFWSRAAMNSVWVEKEWKFAYDNRGLDFIQPVPLEDPDTAPLPEKIASKHFFDKTRMYLDYLKLKTQYKIIENTIEKLVDDIKEIFEISGTRNELEMLKDIQPLVERLIRESKRTNSFSLQAYALLLQGKISLLKMNIGDAKQYLTKAQLIAEDHNLQILAQQISSEHDKLLELVDDLLQLEKKKAPVSERLNLVSLDSTLDQLQGKRPIEPPDLASEEPILLLIMGQDGVAYFNHPFVENWSFGDIFSSFMSAFNSFSSEIFAKNIDRIKIDENVILIMPVDSFLVCYVIKGQSYPALQKLARFSDAIKWNTEISKALKRSAKTGEELDLNNPASLGVIVNEIFNM
ncbi:MAG: toll/interleukin-1 receptor domain-containing protein [Candidatus Thorarchaeota archaeon]